MTRSRKRPKDPNLLAAEIVRHLAPQLRPKYLALPVERFVMEMSSDIAEAVPHVTVEIRDTAQRQLVTAIEIGSVPQLP